MVHEVCSGSGGVGAGRSAKSLGFEKEGDVGDLVCDLDGLS